MRSVWSVVKGPLITEKALEMKENVESYGRLANTRQILTFRVDAAATKPEIKSAIEQIFKVKVDTVRTINCTGKLKRVGRNVGRRPSWKIAFVTVKAGENPVEYDDAV